MDCFSTLGTVPLEKAEGTGLAGLFHFELENAEGVFAQAPDLGER